jgi:DNA-binding XRE family transcriptional regulator
MITKETTANIAILFKATRKFHRLQQTEFSAILGVTQGTISKIESGTMGPELGLWFKFLKAFNIQDPYCFTYAGIEYNESAFQNIKKEGTPLAPKVDFNKGEFLFTVRKIRPLFDFVLKNHSKTFETFLKNNKISPEIFYVLNHPLSGSFVDLFFTFLDENKINAKSLSLLDLNFDSALGRQMEKLRAVDSSENIFSILNNQENSLFEYEFSEKKGEYFITIAKDEYSSLKNLSKSDFVINYNILYPYHFLKSAKNLKVGAPVITELDNNRWQVLYA